MSIIAGIIQLNAQAIDQSQLRLMAQGLEIFDRTEIREIESKAVGLLQTISKADIYLDRVAHRRQSEISHLNVVIDGRIDNRSELFLSLGLSLTKEEASVLPVTALIALCYLKWGDQFASKLAGSFAIALHDKYLNRSMLVRDFVGAKPLFYARVGDSLYFSSAMRPLLKILAGKLNLNIPLLQEFLVGWVTRWVEETVYKEIARIAPAHQMVIRDSHIDQQQYYRFHPTESVCYKDERQWLEAFDSLYTTIVKEYNEEHSPTTIAVSGGLDSSAIAATLHHHRTSINNAGDISLGHFVYQKTPSANEQEYFDLVAHQCQDFASYKFSGDNHWSFHEAQGLIAPMDDLSVDAQRSHTQSLLLMAKHFGSKLILTGDVSNYTFGEPVYFEHQTLRNRSLLTQYSEVGHHSRISKQPITKVLANAYTPKLVKTIYSHLKHRTINQGEQLFPWAMDANNIYKEVQIRHSKQSATNLAGYNQTQQAILKWILRPYEYSRYESLANLCAVEGIECRTPYVDRRMIQFTLSTPIELLCARGKNKILLSKQTKGQLPYKIRHRNDRPGLADLYSRGIKQEYATLRGWFDDSLCGDLGLINNGQFSKNLDTLNITMTTTGRPKAKHYYLKNVLMVEQWLRMAACSGV